MSHPTLNITLQNVCRDAYRYQGLSQRDRTYDDTIVVSAQMDHGEHLSSTGSQNLFICSANHQIMLGLI